MLKQDKKGILLKVKVVPKGSRNEIIGWEGDELRIRIAAPPEKGEANAKLIQFLADFFSIGKSKIILLDGLKSRHKVLCFSGITIFEMEEKLNFCYSSKKLKE